MNKNDGIRMTWCSRVRRFVPLTFGPLSLLTVLLMLQPSARAQAPDAASAPEASPNVVVTAPARPVAKSNLPAPATVPSPPIWQALSAPQKIALAPLEREWDGLDALRRSKWLSIATRFSTLPAEEQTRMHERMRDWARSSPDERQQARIGFQGAQQIASDQRQAKWEAYQALPPEKRQELADKAAQKHFAKPPARPAVNDGPQPKSNLVPAALRGLPMKSVAPSVLQAKPGATTVLITQIKTLPPHQQAGQTKVFADPDLVDSKTLLPKRRLVAASQ